MKLSLCLFLTVAPGVAALGACGGTTGAADASVPMDAAQDSPSSMVDAAQDSPSSLDGAQDTGAQPDSAPNACDPIEFPDLDGGRPAWATDGGCPEAGCPSGTMCVEESLACCNLPIGCAPASCGCTVCGQGTSCQSMEAGVLCVTPTQSRRAVKADIDYVDEEEREALAREALAIRLARYRYKTEPSEARRRLGFLIDDMPDPSPAVQEDRKYVDEYGYTSLLLATVQEQEKQIRALETRVEALEHKPHRK